jgi:phosphohistidine phosphatase
MKTLLLLRHAKSDWSDSQLSDHDRPLNARGQRDAPRMGCLVRDHDLVPDLIVSSTAVRAATTARCVAENCAYPGEVMLEPELYAAPPQEYLNCLQQISDDYTVVMVVGHNPGLEDLLEVVTGSYQKMPTAALAHITFDILHWCDIGNGASGQLISFWRPKDLK